ncbi:MAG: PLP-dependent aspartate aminotransferase family protein [Treponema sp.]|jgi:cystathionine beta-lyase/cystathionine gamma-synthase|nr:PLP-dependent aspartate aminotransferase family protein [Treponema sp.]
MKISTICVHGAQNSTSNTGSVTVPIYQAATYAHPGLGRSTGYDYSRTQNPTREYLERTVANLEEGCGSLAFSTGMAAVTAFLELFNSGDTIIASDDLYGGTVRLFDNMASRRGIKIDYVNTSDLKEIENAVTQNTKALFIETPTNPMMRVTDIAGAAAVAKKNNLMLIVDNTFLTPYFQKPIPLGADIVIHSGTKYLGGHNDTLAGFIVCAGSNVEERLRLIYKTTGACLSPFDSFLLIRGVKTLALRMERHEQNARIIAAFLCAHPKVKKVFYPGLENHPDIEVSKRQSGGFGGMISFETDSEETAVKVLEKVKLILFAESLGGVETLVTYPLTQTHADIPPEKREQNGINERLLRLSVGIEDAYDIIADLKQALE